MEVPVYSYPQAKYLDDLKPDIITGKEGNYKLHYLNLPRAKWHLKPYYYTTRLIQRANN